MKSLDRYEREVLGAYEKGALVSVRPTKAQLVSFRDSGRSTIGVLQMHVSGSLNEKRPRLAAGSTATARKRAAR